MAEKESDVSVGDPAKDDGLEELLDSAYADFDKTEGPKKPEKVEGDAGGSELWDKEFLLEAQKQFEQNMKALFTGNTSGAPVAPDEFNAQLQKLAEEANKVFTEHAIDPEFSATIAQTLKSLSEDTENLQAPLGNEAITAMFDRMGLGGPDDQPCETLPLMQSMMQSFLSKEMFYPSLKEVTEKYPQWLETHKSSLSQEEYDNYAKQFELMGKVCSEFETETDSDSDEVKKERFSRIFNIMMELEKLGKPPSDLVADELPFNLDDLGLPLPGQKPGEAPCSLM